MMIKLVLTCSACPEQYDAFLNGAQVGYLRLRHGAFRVDFPDHNGETIYEASPQGDGCFDEDERDYYLRFAVDAILKRLAVGKYEKQEAPDVQYEIEGRS
ncbi:hypothetical protein [Bradyrhizobium sp. Tv2a-2]|uniref:hypothetical protein n=1 Tax=Bradyrhizobium sp. Tv2a-2 TaxID=113395 RepID=UPI0004673F22|nr:hypothetical protein [Bradyrhizobium sp. Tv2a-2]